MGKKTRVLFICTGNSARSQMAEAFLRRYGGDHFEAHSAGLEPSQIHPLTREVMTEIGMDLQGQYAKGLGEYLGKVHFGYVITVCDRAERNCPVFPGVSVRLHWPFEDPAAVLGTEAEKREAFRRVRDQVEARIRAWLKEQAVEIREGE